MAMTDSARQLGCGRDMDDVWAGMQRPPDAHEAECVYCQAARSSLAELALATDELTAVDLAELAGSAQLVDRILDVARSEVRRGRRLSLVRSAPDSGELSVSEQAVGTLVRQTGDRLAGVQVRRCTVQPVDEDPPGAGDPTTEVPAAVRIEVRVSVDAARPIAELSDVFRQRVISVVEADVGLAVARVDVIVEDLHA